MSADRDRAVRRVKQKRAKETKRAARDRKTVPAQVPAAEASQKAS